MRRVLGFVGIAVAITFGGAWAITSLVLGEEMARAVWSSAVLAVSVQVLAFAIVRRFVATNLIAGWGLGALLRFTVLVLYAFVGVKVLALAPAPALLSLAGFLFVTMLVETLFLRS